ncbi:MAG: von Willebrand factor type A domain-containing protein, partial [Chloroflexi bacterium]|nr:von Willebrand factor type A domain-containing protein [Chloroflexota bacterium]
MRRLGKLAIATIGIAALGLALAACSTADAPEAPAPPAPAQPASESQTLRQLPSAPSQPAQPAAPMPSTQFEALSRSTAGPLPAPSAQGGGYGLPGDAYGFSTGGSATVNDAPYDATFFKHYGVNPFIDTEDDRFSTFAMDVDTASYTVARRFIQDGYLPDPASVRVEEFVNFFGQGYAPPEEDAFTIHVDGAP